VRIDSERSEELFKKLPAEKLRFLGERKKALLMLNQTGGYL